MELKVSPELDPCELVAVKSIGYFGSVIQVLDIT